MSILSNIRSPVYSRVAVVVFTLLGVVSYASVHQVSSTNCFKGWCDKQPETLENSNAPMQFISTLLSTGTAVRGGSWPKLGLNDQSYSRGDDRFTGDRKDFGSEERLMREREEAASAVTLDSWTEFGGATLLEKGGKDRLAWEQEKALIVLASHIVGKLLLPSKGEESKAYVNEIGLTGYIGRHLEGLRGRILAEYPRRESAGDFEFGSKEVSLKVKLMRAPM